MNLNDIIGKLTGEVEHMLDFLEWEERRFLEGGKGRGKRFALTKE